MNYAMDIPVKSSIGLTVQVVVSVSECVNRTKEALTQGVENGLSWPGRI